MRLLDVAEVVTGDTHFPDESDPRECAVTVVIEDICDTDPVSATVIDGADFADTYPFKPFGIEALLSRRVTCHRDDDLSWLEEALKDATEPAVGRALVTQPYPGANVWIGNAAVVQAADVAAGRVAWAAAHIARPQSVPILHVAPSAFPQLVKDGFATNDIKDGQWTIWGDPVVVNSGYEGFPPFWTGEVRVYLS